MSLELKDPKYMYARVGSLVYPPRARLVRLNWGIRPLAPAELERISRMVIHGLLVLQRRSSRINNPSWAAFDKDVESDQPIQGIVDNNRTALGEKNDHHWLMVLPHS